MRTLRNIVVLALVGAIVGAVVASFLAPVFIGWYQSPGGGTAMCECATVSRQAVSQLLRAQLIGAAAGAVGFLVLGVLIKRRGGHKRVAEPPAPPPERDSGAPPGTTGPLK